MIRGGASSVAGPVSPRNMNPPSSANGGGEGGEEGGGKGHSKSHDSWLTNAARCLAIYRPHQRSIFRSGTAAVGEFLRRRIPRVPNTMLTLEDSGVMAPEERPG